MSTGRGPDERSEPDAGGDGAPGLGVHLLGPVSLDAGGRPAPIGLRKARTLLAALALDPGRPVSADTLIERIWGECPPPSARNSLHVLVTRLRRALTAAQLQLPVPPSGQAAAVPDVPVRRHPAGYVLGLPPSAVDLGRFRLLRDQAAEPGRSERERAALLGGALDLWTGQPLGGISGPWVEAARAALEVELIELAVPWGRALIETGRPGPVIRRVRPLLTAFPLVEPLAEVLMLALHAAGRDPEAIECFVATRDRLVDQLGTEPGRALQELHLRLLRGEPAGLGLPAGSRLPAGAGGPEPDPGPVPRELPPPVPAFTGRASELDTLDAWLPPPPPPDAGPEGPDLVVVSGTAGVGKTALAVAWAHRRAGDYPDGQLFLDLRGYDPDQPVGPDRALARMLTALGLPDREIPESTPERAALFRARTTGRRLLIVLDNASSVDQVRPLLPSDRSGAVLVTSRDPLSGLAAGHGARRLDLDLLPLPEAVELLRRLVGERVDAAADDAAALAHRCVRLPLALRVAAELAVARPSTRLADLVAELDDRQRRLDALHAGGDPRTAVRVVFSWSLKHLPDDVVRGFGRLGLHPGPDFDDFAAAALLGSDLTAARTVLGRLARAYLVQAAGPGGDGRPRYGMHDLLRAYAAELATETEADAASLDRLFDYYAAVAAGAMDVLMPAERRYRPAAPTVTTPVPALDSIERARGWLSAEYGTLVAVALQSPALGRPEHLVRLSATLYHHLDFAGQPVDALTIHAGARKAAQQLGDLAGEGHALIGRGVAALRLARFPAAQHDFEQALALFRQAGDPSGQARAFGNLGIIAERSGRPDEAVEHFERALALFRDVGDPTGEARALSGLGLLEEDRGRYEAAVQHHRRALHLYRLVGEQAVETASALTNLGDVEARLGRYADAAEYQREAIRLFRGAGVRLGEAWCLTGLGTVQQQSGEPGPAAESHRQALAMFDELGVQDGRTWALNGLGEALAGPDPLAALAAHREAVALATTAGMPDQWARAAAGLARAHRELGDLPLARTYFAEALARYTQLAMPEAERVQRELDLLPCPEPGAEPEPGAARVG